MNLERVRTMRRAILAAPGFLTPAELAGRIPIREFIDHGPIELMCPANRLGDHDLFIVSHHGQAISNSPALVHAIQPRVAVINNGTRKGGQPDAMKVLFSVPRLEDIWQLHFSQLSGQEYTVPGVFIANTVDDQPGAMAIAPMPPPARGSGAAPPPLHNGPSFWIKISARQDGSLTVTNARNGFSKTYAAR